MMEIITLVCARENKLMMYFTGRPCVRGHVSERYASQRTCAMCVDKQSEKWRVNNPQKLKEKRKEKYKRDILANPSLNKENELRRSEKSRERAKKYLAVYRETHKDEALQHRRIRY